MLPQREANQKKETNNTQKQSVYWLFATVAITSLSQNFQQKLLGKKTCRGGAMAKINQVSTVY